MRPPLYTGFSPNYSVSGSELGRTNVRVNQLAEDVEAGGVSLIASPSSPEAWQAAASVVVPATGGQDVLSEAIAAGPVHLAPGNYYIDAPIEVGTTNPVVTGSGWSSAIRLQNGSNCYAFEFTPPGDGVRGVFTEFHIDGNGANQTSGGGIHAVGAVQSTFRRIWIANAATTGLWLDSFLGNGTGAFGHHNKVVECLFDNTITMTTVGRGMLITGSDENLISSEFQYLGGGVNASFAIRDQSGLNLYRNSVFVGGRANMGGIELRDGQRGSVIGCTFDGVSGDNILVASSSFHTIIGNTFTSVADQATVAGTYSGIHLEYAARECVVSGNVLETSATAGKTRTLIRERGDGDAGLNIIVHNVLRAQGTGTASAGLIVLEGIDGVAGPNIIAQVVVP